MNRRRKSTCPLKACSRVFNRPASRVLSGCPSPPLASAPRLTRPQPLLVKEACAFLRAGAWIGRLLAVALTPFGEASGKMGPRVD